MIGSLLRSLPGIVVGVIFMVAGILKAVDPAEFIRQIESYGIVSGRAAVFLAYVIIPLELALGSALVLGYRVRTAAGMISLLLVAFMAATAYAWSQGKTEGCGCFGSVVSRTPGEVLMEDTVFLALALLAALFQRGASKGSRWRASAVAMVMLVAGFALPQAAYSLPLDAWVTAVKVGKKVSDLPLSESPVDLTRGDHLVALLDLEDPRGRDIVRALNALNDKEGRPPVIAFYGGEVDERTIFCFNTSPSFEVVAVPRADLKRLYRRLPRFFRLQDGRVSKIWDGNPPGPEEV